MNKTAKSLLIPIAAFAVTVTGVSAFNEDVLEKAGLSKDQISAFEEAHELRKDGDKEGARDILMDAGIDLETMHNVREVMHKHREAMKNDIDEAIENNDYEAFLSAIEGSPLADIINSESDFELFKEAHELKMTGDHKEAHEIMEELGFEHKMNGLGHHREFDGHKEGRVMGFKGGKSD